MPKLNNLKEIKDKRIGLLARATEREIEKRRKNHEREIQNLSDKYHRETKEIKNESDSKKGRIEESYNHDFAAEILRNLKKDYSILKERSELTTLSMEDIERAQEINKLINKAENDEEKERLMGLIKLTSTPEIKKAVEALSLKEGIEKRDITSYLAVGTKDSIPTGYLLVPIDSNQNKKLVEQSLENKIATILDQRTIQVGSNASISKVRGVEEFNINEVSFSQDYDEVNGFLLYTIILKQDVKKTKIEESLVKKINELQPEELKKVSLTHVVEVVDFQVINYFATHSEEDLHISRDNLESIKEKYISPERAAEYLEMTRIGVNILAGKKKIDKNNEGEIEVASLIKYLNGRETEIPKKRVSKYEERTSIRNLNYDSTNPEGKKEEILRALDKMGEKIYTKEIANLLGWRVETAYTYIKRYPEDLPSHKEADEKRYVTKDDMISFIEQRKPTKLGWLKIKAS